MASKPLYRLDETLWSLRVRTGASNLEEEVRIQTPGFSNRTADYELAYYVAKAISQQEGFVGITQNGINLSLLKNVSPEIQKNWEICDITEEWYKARQKGSLYSHSFTNLGVRIIELRPSSYSAKITATFFQGVSYLKSWVKTPRAFASDSLSKQLEPISWKTKFLEEGVFSDSFTELAAEALQKDETPFISEKEAAGSYYFALEGNSLRLKSIKTAPRDVDHTATVKAYRKYLKNSFAWRILDRDGNGFDEELQGYNQIFGAARDPEEQLMGYLKCTFGIDFAELIVKNQPLLPDHVFKCNIAVCNIEMPQVESLFLRIDRLLKKAKFDDSAILSTPSDFGNFINQLQLADYFSLRELRGIYCSFRKFAGSEALTSKKFREYLNSFRYLPGYEEPGYGEKIRDLEPEAFHRLMEILYVDTGLIDPPAGQATEPERFFTGRKIVHLGICGYKTMGNKKVYDASRNLFELLHIFRSLREGDEQMKNELLAFIVAKKSLWSHYPVRPVEVDNQRSTRDRERRVSSLFPLRDQTNGKTLWYYVDGLLDDNKGDFNYVLVPANKGYIDASAHQIKDNIEFTKRTPLIKLYRSTASDPEAQSSINSLLADVNPKHIGSLDFKAGDEYEVSYFARCTMPTWVGYLIMENISEAAKAFNAIPFKIDKTIKQETSEREKRDLLTHFLSWQISAVDNKNQLSVNVAEQRLATFIEAIGEARFRQFLTETLQGMEWEKMKVAQDIDFVGHSLGGALSASGVFHFGPEQDRVPLYGCNFKCNIFDNAGVNKKEARRFLAFGRRHTQLLAALDQKWKINMQVEYQDFVPQGGTCFLFNGYDRNLDEAWLEVDASICKPLPSAQDIVITTAPTHGRRFSQGVPGRDYRRDALSIEELNTLKSAWWLPQSLRRKFGYRLLMPWFGESIRRGIPGTTAFTYFWVNKQVKSLMSPKNPELDKKGVLFCTYRGRQNNRGYTNHRLPF